MDKLTPEVMEHAKTCKDFAEQSRAKYKHTQEWTTVHDSAGLSESCETIRVPVAMLNRFRELFEYLEV